MIASKKKDFQLLLKYRRTELDKDMSQYPLKRKQGDQD